MISRSAPLRRRTPLRRATFGTKRTSLPRQGSKGKLLARLDGIAKEIVILRDGNHCRRCLRYPRAGAGGAIHMHHIFPKGAYPRVRYHLGNLILLCYYHHIEWWHKSADDAIEWITRELGEPQFQRLRIIALGKVGPPPDYAMIELGLCATLAEMRAA